MAEWLRARVTFPKSQVQFPAPTWLLITIPNSVPDDLMSFSDLHRQQVQHAAQYTPRQNTHTHKVKINLKKHSCSQAQGTHLYVGA